MSSLIPVVSDQINGQSTLAVNARDLHAALEVGKDFSNWIKDRIQQYGFQENQDFRVFANFGENLQGGRPAKEYCLTLDMAKELAMVERTEKGRIARRYFIDCERMARGQQADLAQLRDQNVRLRALVFELKPEFGVIVRCRQAGLTRLQTAGALGWGEKRVRLATHTLANAGLLPKAAGGQLALGY